MIIDKLSRPDFYKFHSVRAGLKQTQSNKDNKTVLEKLNRSASSSPYIDSRAAESLLLPGCQMVDSLRRFSHTLTIIDGTTMCQ